MRLEPSEELVEKGGLLAEACIEQRVTGIRRESAARPRRRSRRGPGAPRLPEPEPRAEVLQHVRRLHAVARHHADLRTGAPTFSGSNHVGES